MYNILHFASSRGLRDSARRRTVPIVQPAGLSHVTLIPQGRPEARETPRPGHAPAPLEPSPRTSG